MTVVTEYQYTSTRYTLEVLVCAIILCFLRYFVYKSEEIIGWIKECCKACTFLIGVFYTVSQTGVHLWLLFPQIWSQNWSQLPPHFLAQVYLLHF